jgi:hypothetical protein
MIKTTKQNWFDTLHQALESEKLTGLCPVGVNVGHGEHVLYTTHTGIHVTLYRDEDGRYERPLKFSVKY